MVVANVADLRGLLLDFFLLLALLLGVLTRALLARRDHGLRMGRCSLLHLVGSAVMLGGGMRYLSVHTHTK